VENLRRDLNIAPLELQARANADELDLLANGINEMQYDLQRDLMERVEHEKALRESQTQLQELAAHVNALLEKQRHEIAFELHDVIGGYLTSLKMGLTRLARRTTAPELAYITDDLMDLAQRAVNDVRRISNELRPGSLDHLGLAVAIEREVKQFAKRAALDCSFECAEPCPAFSSDVAIGVYRILQESLTNVARHAGAKSVSVRLSMNEDTLCLEIIDDGQGFVEDGSATASLGIFGMRERARELGGSIDIAPYGDSGTRVLLTVPINKGQEETDQADLADKRQQQNP
jgi:two-component system sensor histidine kinase UhpB